jgi:ubiquinone/menaquinone biosynthesis C-methylase UbiE
MISPALLQTLACPVCLEPEGCPRCARPPGHLSCADYGARAACGCGGPDKLPLERDGASLRCSCCGIAYPVNEQGGYVDLVPRTSVGALTQYADHEFHERLHVTDAPPVLSARVKADMMRRMLGARAGETVLDLGCGSGKFALYVARDGVRPAGLDVAPFFLPRAVRAVDLVLGDLRRLPFRKASYPRAYSLDVLEHLDEAGVAEVLLEARRTLARHGRLFIYTHAMESSRLASFQRLVNRLARRLGALGLIDYDREALRKSDHRNAIRSHEHFEALAGAAGLEVEQRRYYNVVFKAVIEDLLLRLYEQAQRGGKPAPAAAAAREPAQGVAPAAVGARPPGRLLLVVASALTLLLKLDVLLFGRIRTGPFFGLLKPRVDA